MFLAILAINFVWVSLGYVTKINIKIMGTWVILGNLNLF